MVRCSPNFCNRSNRKKPSHFSTNVSTKSRPCVRPASDRTLSFLVRMRSRQKLPLILRNFVILRSIADAFTSSGYGCHFNILSALVVTFVYPPCNFRLHWCGFRLHWASADENDNTDPVITIKMLRQLAVFDPLAIIERAWES